MREAAAIVQPSLFEGWSALLEEARSLGKLVFASDIPMHREEEQQNRDLRFGQIMAEADRVIVSNYCSYRDAARLSPAANERFMRDIHRLLKRGGIYRVSTPDLEFFATEYLQRLHEQTACASVENYARYRWAVCNLIDQCVREESGGEMIVGPPSGRIHPRTCKAHERRSARFPLSPIANCVLALLKTCATFAR